MTDCDESWNEVELELVFASMIAIAIATGHGDARMVVGMTDADAEVGDVVEGIDGLAMLERLWVWAWVLLLLSWLCACSLRAQMREATALLINNQSPARNICIYTKLESMLGGLIFDN
jgi:hypothetical protein